MRISVIGCGYLGAVHAASMAKLGHEVVGIDVDQRKITELQAGRAPFFEPGLPELLTEVQETGRLKFSTSMADAEGAQVHFVCVGTPQRKGEYAADLTYVDSAFYELIPYLHEGDIAVGKSTVPVGTAARLASLTLLVNFALLCAGAAFARPEAGREVVDALEATHAQLVARHLGRACGRAAIGPVQRHGGHRTVDLYEQKDPAQVLQCLGAFSRAANNVNPSAFPVARSSARVA